MDELMVILYNIGIFLIGMLVGAYCMFKKEDKTN